MRTAVVALIITAVLSLFGQAAIEAAGDVGPGDAKAFMIAGDVGPGDG